MVVETRLFGKIDIDDEKIICFPKGIVGFPDMQKFTLIYDSEKSSANGIKWLQSMDEPTFAMPVLDPLCVCETYNPMVDDELLSPIGELNPDDVLVLCTLTVPKDVKEMTVNLQAPIVVNAATKKACQVIIDDENGKYPVKFKIYEILKAKKEKAGE